ncbi:Crp/Fnr family transcriptional regulator [Vannielia litorea]|uniref:cAMP-binding domain of CRP or a regulatory subunit of cAMP-dependent protein kinases n=1 Tax=Vannielia litorea TaxID=1217970 RepID=A0A1N6EWL5_9RHOB|nr:Crp/Fnr family transcriptional regulator [Vannielia litorea]SIN87418.1 cAMP-binding domain of CRP or a regulatory subunit of cAMP-dependent protein kinases [Vannielia litorea]
MEEVCKHCPVVDKETFAGISLDELRGMKAFKVGELAVDPGAVILMEGANSPQLYVVMEGMGLRYKLLEDGARQVLNFVMPGDVLGLQAAVMGEMGHSVEASTSMRLAVFNRKDLWDFFRSHPERAFDLTWVACAEEHFLGEALLTVGQRSAVEAIAWALVRLYSRGKALGLTRNGEMKLPFRQQDLADALGLSLVHTNKSLAKLRDRKLATWRNGTLAIHDVEEMRRVAKLDAEESPKVRALT